MLKGGGSDSGPSLPLLEALADFLTSSLDSCFYLWFEAFPIVYATFRLFTSSELFPEDLRN